MPPFFLHRHVTCFVVWAQHRVFADIAQLGERQTEDLKVPGSIPGGGIFLALMLALALA